MKKTVLFSLLLFILFTACGNKESAVVNNSVQHVSDNHISESETVYTSPEVVLTSPYPEDVHGVWGNVFYLESLIKHNSVSKALELVKFDTDIKIVKDVSLSMRPHSVEPAEFDTTKYTLLRIGADSLYVRSKNTGDKQLYLKLINMPDSIPFDLYDNEAYSAISHMEWKWFHGKYDLIKNGTAKQKILFSETGAVIGMQYDFYTFGVDVDGKDYLYMSKDNGSSETFFLIEYQQDGSFDCYNVEEVEDWEYPFVKSSFAFKLAKRK